MFTLLVHIHKSTIIMFMLLEHVHTVHARTCSQTQNTFTLLGHVHKPEICSHCWDKPKIRSHCWNFEICSHCWNMLTILKYVHMLVVGAFLLTKCERAQGYAMLHNILHCCSWQWNYIKCEGLPIAFRYSHLDTRYSLDPIPPSAS